MFKLEIGDVVVFSNSDGDSNLGAETGMIYKRFSCPDSKHNYYEIKNLMSEERGPAGNGFHPTIAERQIYKLDNIDFLLAEPNFGHSSTLEEFERLVKEAKSFCKEV